MELGASAQPDAVQDRQPDRDGDALFHPDEDHRQQRHRGEPELEEIEAGDGTQVARFEEPDRHEDQDGRERRQGHVFEDIGHGDEQDDDQCRPERARLGAAARR